MTIDDKLIEIKFELNPDNVINMLKRLKVDLNNQQEVDEAIKGLLIENLFYPPSNWGKSTGFTIKISNKTTLKDFVK